MTGLKKIVNRQEEAAYRELQNLAAEYGYDVHVKIRLADVLRIEGSGIEDAFYTFALQSHFDFLVCDVRQDPLFAVEFDGPTHGSRRRKHAMQRKMRSAHASTCHYCASTPITC
jgi:hypothetical protein